jgi:hypothetical protein
MNRTLPSLAATVLAALLATGCASDADTGDAAPASTGSAASPAPSSETEAAVQQPAPCFNPYGGQCLGPLEPGTYRTRVFEPAIRYTVPAGWVNAEDLPGNFWLYREDDPQEGFTGGSYVGIYTGVRAPDGCGEAWADGVGQTPAELAQWYADHPGLAAGEPRPVEVGGLEGLLVDVPLAEDWKGRCPWSRGKPVVPLIIGDGVSDVHHVTLPGIAVRLILLEWRDSNVTIEVTSVDSQHSRSDYLALVEPILDSLTFRTR